VGRLQQGSFPLNGQHARVLIGPKGSGKTIVLRHMVRVAEATHPDVLAVYVDCARLQHVHVMQKVFGELSARGYVDGSDVPDVPLGEEMHAVTYRRMVLGALKRHGKRLFLVVDHLEAVYGLDFRVSSEAAQAGVTSLYSLSSLGSLSGDRTAVLVVGSTGLLPLLMTRKDVMHPCLQDAFPNVEGAPDMNGAKFRKLRLLGGPAHGRGGGVSDHAGNLGLGAWRVRVNQVAVGQAFVESPAQSVAPSGGDLHHHHPANPAHYSRPRSGIRARAAGGPEDQESGRGACRAG
jgi:hypothetical protein